VLREAPVALAAQEALAAILMVAWHFQPAYLLMVLQLRQMLMSILVERADSQAMAASAVRASAAMRLEAMLRLRSHLLQMSL
jgi:hypothetical protein